MKKVLIVEDEGITALFIKNCLKKAGLECVGVADNYEDALEIVKLKNPSIALLDISIKGRYDGVDIANKLIDIYDIKVIFITAFYDDSTLKRALNCTPSNYLVKPIESCDLEIALKLIQNHSPKIKESQILELNDEYLLDFENAKIVKSGVDIALTKKEFLLLGALCKKRGEIVDFHELHNIVWRRQSMNLNSLRNLVNSLREKLKGVNIESIRGSGYRLKI